MTLDRLTLILVMTLTAVCVARGQQVSIIGEVLDADSQQPVEYAYVALKEQGVWAVTDARGVFRLRQVPVGAVTLTVQCLGYAPRRMAMTITKDIPKLRLTLKPENLKLDEVTVTARRKRDEATTSYTIDRAALESQQIINLSDIDALLPGGKTVNPTLMSDNRMALRSGGGEMGNASFGTAVEVDGVRLNNNATAGETTGSSTRTVSTANIERVEIITGIPSVEYGDLSNGMVKVHTRKGKSPFIVEGRINQHTRQIAVSKGFSLGRRRGMLNASLEHARSFSDAASPYTAYQRNALSLNWQNTFFTETTPLTLNVGVTGNLGGYDSKADPDEEMDDYSKSRDNALRSRIEASWLLNKKWITNLRLKASLSYGDQKSESYTHTTSASTQPYIHTLTEGYHIARQYDDDPTADIILGPTGAWNEQRFGSKDWYVRRFVDSKPLSWEVSLKGEWARRFAGVMSNLKIGAGYTGSRNDGRGAYYEDMRYAPTWREYRYDELPSLHNLSLYAEEKVSIPTGQLSAFELTAGLRDDITMVSGSDYGTVSSLSPRVNSRYVFWRDQRRRWVSELVLHAGWGKSVKLPSFQLLYPSPRYFDDLAFSSPSTADNTSFYAYYTYVSTPLYNASLRWQYTNQTDIGAEMRIKGTRVSLSVFHHRTHRPYMSATVYKPFAYKYTPPKSLDNTGIPSADREYHIDPRSGVVSVSDKTGAMDAVTLAYNERRTFQANTLYDNGSAVDRYGLEWMVDFRQIHALRTSIRLDGNYYYYKGVDEKLVADVPFSNLTMADGQPYKYIGYYIGGASVSNGTLTKRLNLNTTLTTHIPQIRLIVALRVEATLYTYSRRLSELGDGTRGYVLADKGDYTGAPYDGSGENQNVAVYPVSYSSWENPDERIPFAEQFLWAQANDPALYNELSKLVVKTNYAYVMNPDRLSAYYSANLNVTKEIGDHVAVSFYANNFFNTMRQVHSSQTGRDTSLFGSGYVPGFYYGLSLKLKI